MKVEILPETTRNPLQIIGARAGVCQHAPIDDAEKNKKRALSCIKSGHGRVEEFVNVEFIVSGISARAARELYTHIGGAPTRLQSSTRYCDYSDFQYFLPGSIRVNEAAKKCYDEAMERISDAYQALTEVHGIPVEDAANILPLGMNTEVVMKCNLRMLTNLMNQRLCNRAYSEMRAFAALLREALITYNPDEWATVANLLLIPKCEALGHCPEGKRTCGRKIMASAKATT